MSNRTFRATIIESNAPYHLDQTLADDFAGMDVTLDAPLRNEDLQEIAGIVEDSWYNGGILVRVNIFDEYIAEQLSEGKLSICPTVMKKLDDEDGFIEGFDLFIAKNSDEIVGEVEEV